MTGTICVYTSHSLSRSYLNHLVLPKISAINALDLFRHVCEDIDGIELPKEWVHFTDVVSTGTKFQVL